MAAVLGGGSKRRGGIGAGGARGGTTVSINYRVLISMSSVKSC